MTKLKEEIEEWTNAVGEERAQVDGERAQAKETFKKPREAKAAMKVVEGGSTGG